MKTKILLILLLFSFSVLCNSQPQKSTWEIGGSGYWMKIKNDEGPQLAIYDFNAQASYFLIRNLAIGGNLSFRGGKEYTLISDPTFHKLFFAPSIEGYLLNHNKVGISIKGAVNFALSNTGESLITSDTGESDEKAIYSYSIGPKISWYITNQLSTHLWIAYRDLDGWDNTSGFRTVVPSSNFDLRWGFSYFLHPKKEKTKAVLK